MSCPEHLYLFVICPNNSGSTLLVQLLGTSPNVSLLPSEGQWVVQRLAPGAMPFPEGTEARNWTSNESKFADPDRYDWPRIKAVWHQTWDLEKRILVEKSPPMVIAAPLLLEQFAPARFLLSIRNPYAVCEGIRRKRGYSLTTAASHWVRASRLQERNQRILRHSLLARYEDVCDRPEEVAALLCEFVPELGGLDSQRVFEVMDQTGTIRNLNEEQISRLTKEDLEEINSVLAFHQDLMESFGYPLLKVPPRQERHAPDVAERPGARGVNDQI